MKKIIYVLSTIIFFISCSSLMTNNELLKEEKIEKSKLFKNKKVEKNRLLKEKKFFDSISSIEDIKLPAPFGVIKDLFGDYTDSISLPSNREAICFKSSDKSDKSIIIFIKSLNYLIGFMVMKDESGYRYFLKCNMGKRVISKLKFGKNLISLNMTRKEVGDRFGMSTKGENYNGEINDNIIKESYMPENNTMVYYKRYFEKNSSNGQRINFYVLRVVFNKNEYLGNDKVKKIDIIKYIINQDPKKQENHLKKSI